jgi:ketosteroid isomerase-like protein
VERYIEGFRRGDHEMILGCLTDDVTWDMPPHFTLSGSAAFDSAIEGEAQEMRHRRSVGVGCDVTHDAGRQSRGTADRNGGNSSSRPSASTW